MNFPIGSNANLSWQLPAHGLMDLHEIFRSPLKSSKNAFYRVSYIWACYILKNRKCKIWPNFRPLEAILDSKWLPRPHKMAVIMWDIKIGVCIPIFMTFDPTLNFSEFFFEFLGVFFNSKWPPFQDNNVTSDAIVTPKSNVQNHMGNLLVKFQ